MNAYSVVIDTEMIRNSMQTNLNESLDLLSPQLLFYILFLGLLPAYFVYKTPLKYESFKIEFFKKIKAFFLSKVINLLKNYKDDYDTSMIYMSDHGESLGENGIYLHGMPYFIAPDAQTHVGTIMWFGDEKHKEVDTQKAYSQDNLFHTLLGLYGVKTEVYKKEMDILNAQP